MRGAGRVVFAAIMLMIVGTINIIYGIGALDNARIFVNDTRYIFTNLNTLGWALIILGVVQLTAGFSLIAGNTYGRVIGIIAGSLGALGALFSIGGSNPWWSLAVFALCVWIVYGIIVSTLLGSLDRAAYQVAIASLFILLLVGLVILRGVPEGNPQNEEIAADALVEGLGA